MVKFSGTTMAVTCVQKRVGRWTLDQEHDLMEVVEIEDLNDTTYPPPPTDWACTAAKI